MRVWLDDVRPMPEGFDYWAKNVYVLYGLLIAGKVSHISFDHDLGQFNGEDDSKNTGYFIAREIEGWVFELVDGYSELDLPRITWDVHSSNPVGRKSIEDAMKCADKNWNILEKRK